VGASAAQAAEPMPVNYVSPADGAAMTQAVTNTPWEISTMSTNRQGAMSVEVARQPTLDYDGTLADAERLDLFPLSESETPGLFKGISNGGETAWNNVPGTYYWQATLGIIDESGQIAYYREYRSPVYRVVITAAPAAPAVQQTTAPSTTAPKTTKTKTKRLTARSARTQASKALAKRFRKAWTRRKQAKVTCKPNGSTARCTVSWIFGAFRYSGPVTVKATASKVTANVTKVKRRRA
jgi:hypothetical protein